jgi:hypothetical protein
MYILFYKTAESDEIITYMTILNINCQATCVILCAQRAIGVYCCFVSVWIFVSNFRRIKYIEVFLKIVFAPSNTSLVSTYFLVLVDRTNLKVIQNFYCPVSDNSGLINCKIHERRLYQSSLNCCTGNHPHWLRKTTQQCTRSLAQDLNPGLTVYEGMLPMFPTHWIFWSHVLNE